MRSSSLLIALAVLVVPALDACKKSPDSSDAAAAAAAATPATPVANAGSTAPGINPKDFTTHEYLKATPGVTHAPHPTLIQSEKHGLPAAALSKLTPQEAAAEKDVKADK